MWAVTGWAIVTWLKLTAALGVVVGVCWWQLGTHSGGFVLACAAAGLVEVYATGQLGKQWATEARTSWWWAP